MKMPSNKAQLRGRCRIVEDQLRSKMPGSLIPTWANKHAEQALAPSRMTPARYRFDAAAAYNADHITPNMVRCPQIRLIRSVRALFALIRRRPIVCREVRSHQGKSVHLIPHHSPGTCKIPPECTSLLVQGTASLQRFAPGSDAAHYKFPPLSSSPSHDTSMIAPSANSCSPSISGS